MAFPLMQDYHAALQKHKMHPYQHELFCGWEKENPYHKDMDSGILINFFCLETKEAKIQDLEILTKNKFCSLKILKPVRIKEFFNVHRFYFHNISISDVGFT
jgi:hypothetical protein